MDSVKTVKGLWDIGAEQNTSFVQFIGEEIGGLTSLLSTTPAREGVQREMRISYLSCSPIGSEGMI